MRRFPSKPNSAHHAEWLSLTETVGLFFAVDVLERVFPQGLDAVDTPQRQRLRVAYDEWRDAVDEQDPQLAALHQEWVRMVLEEGLEYDQSVLVSRERLGERLSVTVTESGLPFEPNYALYKNDQSPELLVKVYAPGVDLERATTGERWTASPLERMTALCRSTGVRLGLVTNGERWMLVRAPVGGVSGYASWYARLWWQEPLTFRAFTSLLGVRRAFGPADQTLEAILAESLEHQEEVTNTLGEQVRRAVEVLVQALDYADETRNRMLLADVSSRSLYEAGLTMMMRLVFVLCAEERDLLLLGEPIYDQYYAVSTLRSQLEEDADKLGSDVLERRQDAWSRLLSVFRVVFAGIEHENLRLPALGGSLFDPDRFPFLEGRTSATHWRDALASPLPIDNRTVLMLLQALQVLEQRGGAQLLSYRSLDVEQIGHVYEGLLEYTVARVPKVTLGLQGSPKFRNPSLQLVELEDLRLDGGNALVEKLFEGTGRSKNAIQNALAKAVDDLLYAKLLRSCNNQPALAERVKPFVHLLRMDNWGEPLVYREGAFAVTRGDDRRETGTHYTPKSLTEQIVHTTLEPVVYIGPAEGAPRDAWRLKTPAELLELKICDPAMGSGAFLVQVCRWLGERLVESWANAENTGQQISVEGEARANLETLEPMPADTDERLLIARRLIAERCLYGVDINPLAVELAKLAIWLTTLAKGRPFGFLDHNLRSGDSLLGVHQLEQLYELDMKPQGQAAQPRLFAKSIESAVLEALELRRALRQTPIRDIRDVDTMAALDAIARQRLEACERVADALVGAALRTGGKPKELAAELDIIAILAGEYFEGDENAGQALQKRAREALSIDLSEGKPPRNPFHWALEFPEVFVRENSGFDAFVGNPPFLGGKRLTDALGDCYRDYLVQWIAKGTRGSADLVAYFFLRTHSLLRKSGCFGLLAVNTIAEGDTRQVGLERMLKGEAAIFAAYPSEAWPGKAAVITSRVHLTQGTWAGKKFLSEREVNFISAFLSDQDEWSPKPLKANEGKSFIGSYILGMGFTMSEEEAKVHIAKDSKNAEVLFPYLNGEDLNSHPEQKPSRWVINFWDWPLDRKAEGKWKTASEKQQDAWLKIGSVPRDFPGRVAADFSELLTIVESEVKPERDLLDATKSSAKGYRKFWWQFGRSAKRLYHTIGRGGSFWKHPEGWTFQEKLLKSIVITIHTKYFNPSSILGKFVFSHALAIFSSNEIYYYGYINSTIVQCWVEKNSSSIGFGIRFTPSDCYETLPLPRFAESLKSELEKISESYKNLRNTIMEQKQISLSEMLNKFHSNINQDGIFLEIRSLIIKIDILVMRLYDWQDIELQHNFYTLQELPENDNIRFTISEPARLEILRRLAALNRERYQQEVEQGLHDKPSKASAKPKASRAKSVPSAPKDLDDLFNTLQVSPLEPQESN